MNKDDENRLPVVEKAVVSSSISVVYQSDRLFVVEKPPGLSFHQRGDEHGLLQTFREGCIETDLEEEVGSLYPVHRLDLVTSGLVMLARDQETARMLGQAFAEKRIEKLYVALSLRKPHKKQGWVIGDMERSRRGTWKLTHSRCNPAITRFLSFSIPGQRPGMRMFLLKPETGKTHQLRVAMKSLGAPILGDPLYGAKEEALAEERTYLHACGLRCSLHGEEISLYSVPSMGMEFLSESFQAVWNQRGDLWSIWEKNGGEG